MDKELTFHDDELIDLGSATEVTKGTDLLGLPDERNGVKFIGGLGLE